MIVIKKINEVFVRVLAERSTLAEISDQFTYYIPNHQFNPKVGNGKAYLFNKITNTFYIGLLPELTEFLEKKNYEYRIEGSFGAEEFSEKEALDFIKTLNLPEKFEVRDYQLKYFIKAVRNYRMVGLSPTNSGKSLLIYLIFRYFKKKTLIVVPSISLVTQMISDFRDYGYEGEAHLISGGVEKVTDKQLIISTWQSIYQNPRKWFADIGVVIGDEVHTFQAMSVRDLMEKMVNTPVRIGVTGTLSEVELNDMRIKGLFGPISKYITQKELIDRGFSSQLFIKILSLYHEGSPYLHTGTFIDYQDEINYLIGCPERNKFIANLALSLKGNTFVMFGRIQHGKDIHEKIIAEATCPIFYVDGQTSAVEREEIRQKIETLENSITVCSVVFCTGINIKMLNNLIFTHPSKSRIRVLQSVGRGLRMKEGKKLLNIFDLCDELVDNVDNTTLKHSKARIKMFKTEQFPFKTYRILLRK